MDFIEAILVLIIGMSAGSFITMASYRLTEETFQLRDLVFQRSHCAKCKNQLQIKNLIPLFSWLFQKGKCSFCHDKISPRYFIIEVFTTLIFFIAYWFLGKKIDAQLIITFMIIGRNVSRGL